MLTEDSAEAESVVPGGSQEAVDAVEVSMGVQTRDDHYYWNGEHLQYLFVGAGKLSQPGRGR